MSAREPCAWCGEPAPRRIAVRHADVSTGAPPLLADACDGHATTLVRLTVTGELEGRGGARLPHVDPQLTIEQEAHRDEHMGPHGHSLVYRPI